MQTGSWTQDMTKLQSFWVIAHSCIQNSVWVTQSFINRFYFYLYAVMESGEAELSKYIHIYSDLIKIGWVCSEINIMFYKNLGKFVDAFKVTKKSPPLSLWYHLFLTYAYAILRLWSEFEPSRATITYSSHLPCWSLYGKIYKETQFKKFIYEADCDRPKHY